MTMVMPQTSASIICQNTESFHTSNQVIIFRCVKCYLRLASRKSVSVKGFRRSRGSKITIPHYFGWSFIIVLGYKP